MARRSQASGASGPLLSSGVLPSPPRLDQCYVYELVSWHVQRVISLPPSSPLRLCTCSLDLGLHGSAAEAATAHDKAALLACGFLAPLNSNLQAVCAAAAAATAEGRRLALQQQEQQEDATVPQQHEIRYRGVLQRSGTAPGILGAGSGTWLALLDLGTAAASCSGPAARLPAGKYVASEIIR
jgi:hypothetical protein